jgi:tetratricopeptide (TPR) repeat protein
MTASSNEGIFTQLFSLKHLNPSELALKGPQHIAKTSSDTALTAWRYLFASMALRKAGFESEANDYLNHASKSGFKDDIFSAEVLSEAGLSLKKAERYSDAINTLDSASALWRDVCGAALDAGKDAAAGLDFAARILKILAACGPQLSVSRESAPHIVRCWLTERAVGRRADVYYGFATLLARAGHSEDARTTGRELLEWMENNFAVRTRASSSLADRVTHPCVRKAFYQLRLAGGEVELADGSFAVSAESFADAARMYEGHTMDPSDVVALLQAKFNEANSLLRLAKWDEALSIYALVEHGFERFATPSALQRVKQAILFARMKKEEESVS